MIKAMLPGSFDPPTNGHMNLIERASGIFEKLYVVIAVNDTKKYMFTADERYEMISYLVKKYDNVEVRLCNDLVVNFAQELDVKVIIRGVRALVDFGYEFELAMTNRELNPDVEVIFMPTDPKYFVLRSSAIKEIASFDGDISTMVPPEIVAELKHKLGRG
ncbi:MAG: pantetheine-phosphate adenylyltransferase [Spirochaetes bacterium]|nr:MAG: pantetheine-phosphate adenylyltransferase [Spirochaetota bacterium]